MFRTTAKALGIATVAYVTFERYCKIRSYTNPVLFKYVNFGLNNEYCKEMILAHHKNICYAPYSDQLAIDISEQCMHDQALLRSVTSNQDHVWWFINNKHTIKPIYGEFACACYRVHKMQDSDFHPVVLQNFVIASKTMLTEEWNSMDAELKHILQKISLM